MPGLALNTGSTPFRRSSLTETPAGPFRTRMLPLPLSCLTSHSAASLPQSIWSVSILVVRSLVSTRLSKLATAMPFGAGVGDDAVERRGRSGVDNDRIELRVDHRLDLLDLRVGVALGVGDRQAFDEAFLLELVRHVFDCPGGLLHPRRDRINVGPADLIRRLVLALDAVGSCERRTGAQHERQAGSDGDPRKSRRLHVRLLPLLRRSQTNRAATPQSRKPAS